MKKQNENLLYIVLFVLIVCFIIYFKIIHQIFNLILTSYYARYQNPYVLIIIATALTIPVIVIVWQYAKKSVNKANNYLRGIIGEVKLRKILEKWKKDSKDKDSIKIYKNIHIKKLGNRDIDFVVVCRKGIFFIEVKNWKYDPTTTTMNHFEKIIKEFLLSTKYFKEKYLKNMYFILATNKDVIQNRKIKHYYINIDRYSFPYVVVDYDNIINILNDAKDVFDENDLKTLFEKFDHIYRYSNERKSS